MSLFNHCQLILNRYWCAYYPCTFFQKNKKKKTKKKKKKKKKKEKRIEHVIQYTCPYVCLCYKLENWIYTATNHSSNLIKGVKQVHAIIRLCRCADWLGICLFELRFNATVMSWLCLDVMMGMMSFHCVASLQYIIVPRYINMKQSWEGILSDPHPILPNPKFQQQIRRSFPWWKKCRPTLLNGMGMARLPCLLTLFQI